MCMTLVLSGDIDTDVTYDISVFHSVGTLTFDTTVFQRNRNVRMQNVFGVSDVSVSKTVK